MSSDDDDIPLTAVAGNGKRSRATAGAARVKRVKYSTSDYRISGSENGNLRGTKENGARGYRGSVDGADSDSDDDKPLEAVDVHKASVSRLKKARVRNMAVAKVGSTRGAKSEIVPNRRVKSENGVRGGDSSNEDGAQGANGMEEDRAYKWWDAENDQKDGPKWKTLVHNAVMFPPEYEPHGVRLLYAGNSVELTPECEEVATFFAAKLDTDYEKKETFRKNFFMDFRAILKGTPAASTIKTLSKCDFSLIKAHLDKLRDQKKELLADEKKALREAEAAKCAKYMHAVVDGREEKVGNFRVEPPGLFLGRGEHPLMGKVKARIYPEDVTINIGADAPVPEVPIPGRRWGKVVHDRNVTWLCGWKDSITGNRKYVFLSAGSAFKGMSDLQKFEKARALSKNIEAIRRDYIEGWTSKSKDVRQRSVAMYLIDKLALRVGNEKTEEEADTVGCCSLRVEHIKLIEPRSVEFDFLGKDSMRYHNVVEVEKAVYENLKLFMRKKKPEDDIFHRLTVVGLNDYLKSLMPGLSAKVFRTYNASVTLDRLLRETDKSGTVNDKTVFYNLQNKEVAILCNHQRSAPKSHEAQMGKMQIRVKDCKAWLTELGKAQRKLKALKKGGREDESVEVTEYKPQKPQYEDDMDDKAKTAERKRAAEAPRVPHVRSMNASQVSGSIKRAKEKLEKLEADMTVKDDLKTVALGTSKINYLDPRITVAWCKKQDVPIERIFAATLLVKFAWAMPTPSTFRF